MTFPYSDKTWMMDCSLAHAKSDSLPASLRGPVFLKSERFPLVSSDSEQKATHEIDRARRDLLRTSDHVGKTDPGTNLGKKYLNPLIRYPTYHFVEDSVFY